MRSCSAKTRKRGARTGARRMAVCMGLLFLATLLLFCSACGGDKEQDDAVQGCVLQESLEKEGESPSGGSTPRGEKSEIGSADALESAFAPSEEESFAGQAPTAQNVTGKLPEGASAPGHDPRGDADSLEGQNAPPPTCTLLVECSTLLDHMEELAQEKRELVPQDGVLLCMEVELQEGDTAYDVLERAARQEKLHLESSVTPAYNSVYIEGIGNLYEFDCGALSGWLCFVNGESLSLSTSKQTVQAGDEVTFCYTCDLGEDLPKAS